MTLIPQEPVRQFEYIDLIALPVLTLIIFNLLHSARKNIGSLGPTISDMLAYTTGTHLIFSISMSILYPLYYSFLWFWVGPLHSMPFMFYILLAISAVAEMVFVWLPAKDRTKLVHIVAASVVGIGMFLITLLILLFSTTLSAAALAGIWVFLVTSISMVLLMLHEMTRKHIFAYEVTYIITFLAAMSLTAHT